MPVWPQLCALMMVVTKVNSVTMTAGTGTKVERDGDDHGDGGSAQADDAGVEFKGARDERLLVGVGGAIGGKTADDTGDLRQDVIEDDGDAKSPS